MTNKALLIAASSHVLFAASSCAVATVARADTPVLVQQQRVVTPVSSLTLEQKRLLVISKQDLERHLPKKFEPLPLRGPAVPPSLDWRNNNGNFVTRVKSQSGPTCGPFSYAAAVESKVLIASKAPGADVDLSERVMTAPWGASSNDFVMQTGLPLEQCLPFDPPGATPCQGWGRATAKIDMVRSYFQPTVEQIKLLLSQYGPVVAFMEVYDDFFDYRGGIYRHDPSRNHSGSHFVLVVGYDDAGRYFSGKNSWGETFGERGFFRISYDEVRNEKASDFGRFVTAFGNAILPLADALDTPGAQWSTGGTGVWWAVAATDAVSGMAAASSDLDAAGSASWLATQDIFFLVPSHLSFRWRIAPGAQSVGRPDEPPPPTLTRVRVKLLVDGTPAAELSFIGPWQSRTVPVPAGKHRFEWIAEQGSGIGRSGRALLDDVRIVSAQVPRLGGAPAALKAP
jgi:hypothetical protein